jgi:hypothetical protein
MVAVRGPLVALSEAAEALVAFSEEHVTVRVTLLLRVLHFALPFPVRLLKRGEEISCHISEAGHIRQALLRHDDDEPPLPISPCYCTGGGSRV